jgi:hypothetical protein
MTTQFFAGAAVVSLLVIALFFVRFWQRTHDRLFLFFAAAFLVLMVERLVRAFMVIDDEWGPYVYCLRLLGFLFIIWAIVDKNRQTRLTQPRGNLMKD